MKKEYVLPFLPPAKENTLWAPAPGTQASRRPGPRQEAALAARGRSGNCRERWVQLERPGQRVLSSRTRAEDRRVKSSPLPRMDLLRLCEARVSPRDGGRGIRLRLHSPGSVPFLAFVGFELRSPPRWEIRRQSTCPRESESEGRVLPRKEANIAGSGAGNTEIRPASPGHSLGTRTQLHRVWGKPCTSKPQGRDPSLRFCPHLDLTSLQHPHVVLGPGRGPYTVWRENMGPGVH